MRVAVAQLESVLADERRSLEGTLARLEEAADGGASLVAAENRVCLLTANRHGEERWAELCGWSRICAPAGDRLAQASTKGEALLVAEVDVALAGEKDILPEPGEYEMRLFDDRRPELYGALVESPVVTT